MGKNKDTKKFGKKKYTFYVHYDDKTDATVRAKRLRKQGKDARVVKETHQIQVPGYGVYIKPKEKPKPKHQK